MPAQPVYLFISPHSDDAVLSCGGLIHQLTRQGEPVTILTVMAGDPPDPLPDTPIVRDLHRRWEAGLNPAAVRREEDRAAGALLGARVIQGAIPDCVYRVQRGRALYPTEESLWHQVDRSDWGRRGFGDWVDGWLAKEETIRRVYLPLGVGAHVDHLIARDYGIALSRIMPVRFYEDYPYSAAESALQQAWAAFSLPLEPETVSLSQEDYAAKCGAIAAYRSQISTFWDTIEHMRARVERHLRQTGAGRLAERYWRVLTG